MSTLSRAVFAAVLIAGLAGGWRWWNGAERQIRRTLDGLADALSHDAPAAGLAAVSAVAGLQGYLAPEAVVELGRSFQPVMGRDAVMGTAARLRAAVPAVRVEFVDVRVRLEEGDAAATVECTATAALTDAAGQRRVDAREVLVRMRLREGRWLVESARALDVLEPVS